MSKKLFLLFFTIFFLPAVSFGQEYFPFLGEVTADKVNVRAGANINFEKIVKLDKNAEVVAVEKSYDWYKVKLSDQAECYVHKKFIRFIPDNYGVVTAKQVNLRAGPGEKFSILGKIDAGVNVRILKEAGEWYKIEPPEGSYGWISTQFIRFKSAEIPPVKGVELPSRNIYKKEEPPPEEKKEELFSVEGAVEDLGRVLPFKNIRYKLIADNQIYYLMGPKEMFDPFVYSRVKVYGTIDPVSKKISPYPVVAVVKIHHIQ